MTDFAAATDRSTPGFDRHRIGDWVLRTSSGATGRANSATLHGDPGMEIASAIDEMEAWYLEHGERAQVMVWDETAADVRSELAARGYAGGRPTEVMAAPVERVWSQLAAPGRLHTRVEAEPPGLLRSTISPERLAEIVHTDLDRHFGIAADDEEDIGTGMAVVDPPLIGIFAMRSREDRQGEGAGSAVIRGLLDGAAERGCGTAWLQVESDNHRANQWYARLGFVTRTSYDYWIAPDPGSDRPDSSQ